MKKTIILLFIFCFFSVSFFSQAEIPEFTLLLKLKEEGRQPGDFFPELMPHFEANSQMVRERLKSTALELTFEETYDFCKSKFEEDGGLTLYSNAMGHFLYAEILKAHQENDENLDFEYNLIKNCFTKNNFKNKTAKEMEEMTCYINKDKNQFHFNQIFQLYFAEAAGLYPLPIVSETGVLDLIDLNKGVANAVLFLGLPLQKTNYDGNVEANSNRFYEHDSNHFDFAQSSFDRCVNTFKDIIDDKIDYMIDIKNRYQIAQKIYNLIEEQRKINQENSYLDNFVYYFLFHEHGFAHGKKTFLTPDFDQQDFCDSIDEVIERVITDIHRITKETQVNDKGEKTEDLYDNETDIQTHIHPENALTIYDFIKAENTKGPKIPCDRYIKYTKNVENDALFDFPFYDLFYYVNYNFLIDLQDMLKPANIDLNLWENNELNEDKIIATIREVFQGFKERYRNLI